jgi:UDP-3-O-[3-hydroxymyristoyl] glucosamine N-acyltransferase
VVFADAKICDNALVDGAIIGEGAVIGKNAKISQGCIVADQVKIKDNVFLTKDSAVCPAKEISETILKRNIIC